MKTMICKCAQCRATKRTSNKRTRVQTLQVRAARHKAKQMLRHGDVDSLPEKIKVDYYA